MPGRKLLGSLLNEGAVYVFDNTGATFDFTTFIPTKYYADDPDGAAQFGSSIAIFDEMVITGARLYDASDSKPDTGAAYVSYIRQVSTNGGYAYGGDACNCPLFNMYAGSCGGLQKKTDKWCGGSDICCADSSSECCETDAGPVAGMVIGLIIGLAASITGCAYCCKCCCFKRALVPVVIAQPVATAPAGVQMVSAPMPVNVVGPK